MISEKICNARGLLLKSAVMKKFLPVICLFLLVFGAANASESRDESVPQLKEKIAKLEAQLKNDAAIISAIRDENRALKRQIRKMKRAALAASLEAESSAQRPAAAEKARAQAETQAPAATEKPTDAKSVPYSPSNRSIWDNVFPF